MKKIFAFFILIIASSPLFSMHMVRARRARLAAERRQRGEKAPYVRKQQSKKKIHKKKRQVNPAHLQEENNPVVKNIHFDQVDPLEQGVNSDNDNDPEAIAYPQYDRDQQGLVPYSDIPDREAAQHRQTRIKKSKRNRKKKRQPRRKKQNPGDQVK